MISRLTTYDKQSDKPTTSFSSLSTEPPKTTSEISAFPSLQMPVANFAQIKQNFTNSTSQIDSVRDKKIRPSTEADGQQKKCCTLPKLPNWFSRSKEKKHIPKEKFVYREYTSSLYLPTAEVAVDETLYKAVKQVDEIKTATDFAKELIYREALFKIIVAFQYINSYKKNIRKKIRNQYKEISMNLFDASTAFWHANRGREFDLQSYEATFQTKPSDERMHTLENLTSRLLDEATKSITEVKLGPCQGKLSLPEFTIVKALGKGQFGSVYLVNHKAFGHFAMKLLQKDHLKKDKEYRRLVLECRISLLAAVYDHPMLMPAFATFNTQDHTFLLMELGSRGTLGHVVKDHSPLELDVIRFYIACIILGLEFLHNNQIVHRDLKPDNILIDQFGYAKLSDYGIAKGGVSWQTIVHKAAGTVSYTAPEVLSKLCYDNTADYWSLGICTYRLLYGKLPFSRESPDKKNTTISAILRYKPFKFADNHSDLLSINNLIKRLLRRLVKARLGWGPNGAWNVKTHPFFASISFIKLLNRELKPPLMPKSCISKKLRGTDDMSFPDEQLFQKDLVRPAANDPFNLVVDTIFERQPVSIRSDIQCDKRISNFQRRLSQYATSKFFEHLVNRDNLKYVID
ncbi:hypothetical protein SNEBB_007566 [Seison nebaliae]|nr:hypothetical protein SNEBB_007566 [Seison nebaliae]